MVDNLILKNFSQNLEENLLLNGLEVIRRIADHSEISSHHLYLAIEIQQNDTRPEDAIEKIANPVPEEYFAFSLRKYNLEKLQLAEKIFQELDDETQVLLKLTILLIQLSGLSSEIFRLVPPEPEKSELRPSPGQPVRGGA